MNMKRIAVMSIAALVLVAGISVYAQMNRPYHNGSVWDVAFIRIKPGMDTAYMNYLAGQWKAYAFQADNPSNCPVTKLSDKACRTGREHGEGKTASPLS